MRLTRQSAFWFLCSMLLALPSWARTCADVLKSNPKAALTVALLGPTTDSLHRSEIAKAPRADYLTAVQLIRSLPPEQLKVMVETYKAMLAGPESSEIAVAMLLAADIPKAEIQNLVRVHFDRWMKRIPIRKGLSYELTYNGVVARSESSIVPGSFGTSEVPKLPGTMEVQTGFFEKWHLNRYADFVTRVSEDLLPVDDGSRMQSSTFIGADSLVRQLVSVGLKDEALTMARVLLTHENSANFGAVAHQLKEDDFLFQGAMYRVAQFFKYRGHLYYAIDPLRLIHSPQMRQKAQDFLIDLAYEISSPGFVAQMVRDYSKAGYDNSQLQAGIFSHAKAVMTGLLSSGTPLYFKAIDSVKFELFSKSNNPKIIMAVRHLIDFVNNSKEMAATNKYGDQKLDELMAYIMTGDRERILLGIQRLELTAASGKRNSIHLARHYLAIGDYKAAVDQTFESWRQTTRTPIQNIKFDNDFIVRAGFNSLFEVSFPAGNHQEFLAYLKQRLTLEQFAVAQLIANAYAEKTTPILESAYAGFGSAEASDLVMAWFRSVQQSDLSKTSEQYFRMAQADIKRGDFVNASQNLIYMVFTRPFLGK